MTAIEIAVAVHTGHTATLGCALYPGGIRAGLGRAAAGLGFGPMLILLGSSMIGVPAFIGFNGDVLEG